VAKAEHRYTYLEITFHWTMAVLILLQLGWGWWMQRAPAGYEMFGAYQRHNDIGFVILLLALVRLFWRMITPRPPYTEEVKEQPGWQHVAARLTHLSFYGLMIGLPVSGWVLLSATAADVPIVVFGLVPLPHLSWIAALPAGRASQLEDILQAVHWVMVWALVALTVVHAGAALKHHFIDRDPVLTRMAPILEELPEEPPEEGLDRA